ncbi:MAG: type II toxin-antitoxin system HicA family toxin [Minisyncoccales bacterium]|jgi:predicted RNA binding protein YcfA (HicA-like mRNA interferase family)
MRLPLISSRELIKALGKIGYSPARQRGSHIRLICAGKPPITVPDYHLIDRSLLKMILREANLSDRDFLNLLNK